MRLNAVAEIVMFPRQQFCCTGTRTHPTAGNFQLPISGARTGMQSTLQKNSCYERSISSLTASSTNSAHPLSSASYPYSCFRRGIATKPVHGTMMKISLAHAPASLSTAKSSSVPLPPLLRRESLPRHIAVIMDGNARWASGRGLTAFQGHRAGLETFKATVTSCHAWNIPALTVR